MSPHPAEGCPGTEPAASGIRPAMAARPCFPAGLTPRGHHGAARGPGTRCDPPGRPGGAAFRQAGRDPRTGAVVKEASCSAGEPPFACTYDRRSRPLGGHDSPATLSAALVHGSQPAVLPGGRRQRGSVGLRISGRADIPAGNPPGLRRAARPRTRPQSRRRSPGAPSHLETASRRRIRRPGRCSGPRAGPGCHRP